MPGTVLSTRDTKRRKGDISLHGFLCWSFQPGHKHQPPRHEA